MVLFVVHTVVHLTDGTLKCGLKCYDYVVRTFAWVPIVGMVRI